MDTQLVQQFETCSTRGWDWIVKNLDQFLPSNPADPATMKSVCELALLYSHAHEWANHQNAFARKEVGDFLNRFLARTDILHFSRKRPAYFVAYVFPYLSLRMTGRRIEAWESALTILRQSGYPRASEKIPFRTVEVRYLLWRAGLIPAPKSWGSSYRATTFCKIKNPAHLVNWEVYSFTHTLFYVTLFAGPPVGISPGDWGSAITLAETLLVHFWRTADWDLTGELLLNLVGLGKSDSSLFSLCAQCFLNVWREDGTVPGPTFVEKRHANDQEKIFEHCYHTTLVALLLSESLLYRKHQADA